MFVGGGTDGDLQGTNAGPFTDAYLRGYDTAGHVLWTRQWGQEGDDQVLSVAADSTGVTAVGYTHADATGNEPSQAFIRRFDRDGHFQWSKIFGSPDSEIAWGVASDAHALTVTGYTFGDLDANNKGSFDVFVRRYSRSGTAVWKRQFGTKEARPRHRRRRGRQGVHDPRPHDGRPGRRCQGQPRRVRAALHPLTRAARGGGSARRAPIYSAPQHAPRNRDHHRRRGGQGPGSGHPRPVRGARRRARRADRGDLDGLVARPGGGRALPGDLHELGAAAVRPLHAVTRRRPTTSTPPG